MAVLSTAQIDALKSLALSFGTEPRLVAAGRNLADRMRRALPDVDDVTIGRALLELGEVVAGVVRTAHDTTSDTTQGEAALISVAGVVACAAINLTEIEWREETP